MLIDPKDFKRKLSFGQKLSIVKSIMFENSNRNQGIVNLLKAFMPRYGEPPSRSTEDWIKYYNDSPRMNPVHQIASDVGCSEYGVYAKYDKNKFKKENHNLAKLLKNPCPEDSITEYTLFYITMVYLLLPTGEAFWLKERNGFDTPTQLWPVPPDWVSEIPAETNGELFIIQPFGNVNATRMQVPKRDMIYFKKPNVVNPYLRGIGRASAIGDELETDEYMAKQQKRYFWNNAIPPIVGQMPGADEDTITRTEEMWQKKYGGYNNQDKTAWLNWDAKFQILKETYKEMDFVESRKYLRDVSNQHFNIPPELFGILENSNRSCYSEDTECLTKNGWKKYNELTYNDEIATWDNITNSLVYSKPSKIVSYEYEGEMHYWKNRSIDVMVTPDHRMYTKTQFKGDFEIKRSYELSDKKIQQKWRATGGNYSGDNCFVEIPLKAYKGYGLKGEDPENGGYKIDVFNFAEFLGFFISEGSINYYANAKGNESKSFAIKISQNVGVIEQEIKSSFEKLNVGNVTSTKTGPGKWRDNILVTHCVCNKSLWHWIKDNVGTGAKNKRIPKCVFDWPLDAQILMFDAMMKGDGSKKQKRTKSEAKYADQFYATSSYGLASDVQHLCVQIGYRSSIRKSTKGKFYWYVLNISSKQFYYVNNSKIGSKNKNPISQIQKINYNGIVWCLEVPSHVFFTRRNGKVACHGNTIDAAYYLYTKNVLRKELKFIDDTLNKQLVPDFGTSIYLQHDNVVPEDKEFELQKQNDGLKWGGITVDEWRIKNGYEPLPNGRGEILYTPLNMIPTPINISPEELQNLNQPAGSQQPKEPEKPDDDDNEKSFKKKGLTEAQKINFSVLVDRTATANERSFINASKKFFQEQQNRVNDRLGKNYSNIINKMYDIDSILEWDEENVLLYQQYSPLWLASMQAGYNMANETFQLQTAFEVVNPLHNQWIELEGLNRAKGINETTKVALRQTLSEGITAGEGIPKLRDRVSAVYGDAKGYRATLIARTETAKTVNYGAMSTYIKAGIEKKEWSAVMDNRTRPEHAALNGEIRYMNELFSNGEMHPGEPNCRCAILPFF